METIKSSIASQENKSFELRLVNTISLLDFDLNQFFDFAGCAVVEIDR